MAKSAIFSGNRQCQYISRIFGALVAGKTDISVSYIADDADLSDRAAEAIQSADVIVLQERDSPKYFDAGETRSLAKMYYIPGLSVDFLWPFGGQPHVLNRPGPEFPDGPFPAALGDAYLNRRIETQFSPDLLDEYVSMPIDQIIDLDDYRASVLEKQSRIDRSIGTDWASAIRNTLCSRPIFLNPLQPAPWVIKEIIRRLLSDMNMRLEFSDDYITRSCVSVPQLPIHPTIARHFNLSWVSGATSYDIRARDSVSFPEYVRRYLAYAEGPDLEVGVRAAAAKASDVALASLRKAVERPLGGASVSAHSALAYVHMQRGEREEGVAAMAKARALEPDNPKILLESALSLRTIGETAEAETLLKQYCETGGSDTNAYVMLAEIHTANGKPSEAARALQVALAGTPPNAQLQSRLTLALAASGDPDGARTSAEMEIKIEPDNPRPRTFLAYLLEAQGKRDAAKIQAEHALTLIKDRPDFDGQKERLIKFYQTMDPPLDANLLRQEQTAP